MRRWRIPILAITLATGLLFSASITSAQAPNPPMYYQKASIPIPPWGPLSTISIDISWVNPTTHMLAIGDRSPLAGGAVEIFDTQNYRFIRAAGLGKFVGVAPTGSAGPNGVTWVSETEVAGGDGDSTLKIVNIYTDAVQTIATGGRNRVDEMAYDPTTDVLLVANDREDPPFITALKVHPLSILGTIPYTTNLAGIEQPVVAAPGKFWVAIPSTQANPKGQIDLINTNPVSVELTVSTGDCTPTGLARGVGNLLVSGSGACVIDPSVGTITTIQGTQGGGDEIATVPSLGVYAFAIAATSTLNLADARTNTVYQQLPIEVPHNVAADDITGEIFVPDYATKSLLVFAPVGGGSEVRGK
jgi:hypothetical protein